MLTNGSAHAFNVTFASLEVDAILASTRINATGAPPEARPDAMGGDGNGFGGGGGGGGGMPRVCIAQPQNPLCSRGGGVSQAYLPSCCNTTHHPCTATHCESMLPFAS